MKMLSVARPLPSMLMVTPSRLSTPVKSGLVNCAPWSVLKISGGPWWRSASSSASVQNSTIIVFDNRHDKMARECQSMMATR